MQVDGCRGAGVASATIASRRHRPRHLRRARATFGEHQTEAAPVRFEPWTWWRRRAKRTRAIEAGGGGEVARYRRRVPGEMRTEQVVRGKDECPPTLRECARRAQSCGVGRPSRRRRRSRRTLPTELTTKFDRAEVSSGFETKPSRRQLRASRGVLHAGAGARAAHHVALANRSACFLKMGEHERWRTRGRASAGRRRQGTLRVGLSLRPSKRSGGGGGVGEGGTVGSQK